MDKNGEQDALEKEIKEAEKNIQLGGSDDDEDKKKINRIKKEIEK